MLARAWPGWRAAIAIAAGILGLAVGAEAVHAVVEPPLAGDDYTGLLAVPAGLILVVTGTHALWRSRHRGGPRVRR